MSPDLTDRTSRLLDLIGDETMKARVLQLFEQKAALYGPPTVAVLERVRFAVIKLAMQGDKAFETAARLYKMDTRDLLMAAEFATDLRAHDSWCTSVLQKSDE